jgi:hypothetical protein
MSVPGVRHASSVLTRGIDIGGAYGLSLPRVIEHTVSNPCSWSCVRRPEDNADGTSDTYDVIGPGDLAVGLVDGELNDRIAILIRAI